MNADLTRDDTDDGDTALVCVISKCCYAMQAVQTVLKKAVMRVELMWEWDDLRQEIEVSDAGKKNTGKNVGCLRQRDLERRTCYIAGTPLASTLSL